MFYKFVYFFNNGTPKSEKLVLAFPTIRTKFRSSLVTPKSFKHLVYFPHASCSPSLKASARTFTLKPFVSFSNCCTISGFLTLVYCFVCFLSFFCRPHRPSHH
eukprot:UN01475